ncbi:MAG: glycerophosphodiester phosphodiesterase [Opitutales bacterium]|nr:glycerophosphodiester phosphodiesterase [Opitutales bacterium]
MKEIFYALLFCFVFQMHATEPLIVAHRGASFDAPENTLPAFELAWKRGADAVEGDFLLSKDGHIVCVHDKKTKKVADQNLEVVTSTLKELQALDVGSSKDEKFRGTRIPTLSQVFATVPKGKKIFVEVKCGPEIIPALTREIDRSGLTHDQIVLICFKPEVIREFKKARPNHKAYWLCVIGKKKGVLTPSLKTIMDTLKSTGADGLDSHFSIPEEFLQAVLDAGYEWHVWTVNDPDMAKQLVQRGVHSITTDRPGFLRDAL